MDALKKWAREFIWTAKTSLRKDAGALRLLGYRPAAMPAIAGSKVAKA